MRAGESLPSCASKGSICTIYIRKCHTPDISGRHLGAAGPSKPGAAQSSSTSSTLPTLGHRRPHSPHKDSQQPNQEAHFPAQTLPLSHQEIVDGRRLVNRQGRAGAQISNGHRTVARHRAVNGRRTAQSPLALPGRRWLPGGLARRTTLLVARPHKKKHPSQVVVFDRSRHVGGV